MRDEPGRCWVKGTSALKLFRGDGEGRLVNFTPISSTDDQAKDKSYPLEGILTSSRLHLGSGTRTGLSERITSFSHEGDVEMSFEDAARLDLNNGDQVKVSSEHGAVTRRVRLQKVLPSGLVYVPVAFQANEARQLIGLTQPGRQASPGWKQVSVRVEKSIKDQ